MECLKNGYFIIPKSILIFISSGSQLIQFNLYVSSISYIICTLLRTRPGGIAILPFFVQALPWLFSTHRD